MQGCDSGKYRANEKGALGPFLELLDLSGAPDRMNPGTGRSF
jgi:hypothetical protein